MLRALIDGKSYNRDAVLAWEARRVAVVRRKLGMALSDKPLVQQRAELTEHK